MAKLTEEMVIARTRQSNLAAVVKLNCWGTELSDVSLLRRLTNVEVLSLSVNKISGLSDFQNCLKLQELFIRKNEIRELNQICYLKHLPRLKVLNLAENPCAYGDGYRLTVLHCLPNLVKLDEKVVTSEEVRDAMRLGKELVHPEEEMIVNADEMICPASPDRYEYLDDTYINGSEDEYYTGQNNNSTSSSKKSPEVEYYPKDGNHYSELQQTARPNMYHSHSGGLDHDGTNGLGSDHGDDDHVTTTNHHSVDFSHISPSSSIPLQTSSFKEENSFPQHRSSVHEDSEVTLLPRLHPLPLTRSRTVDSVGDVNPRGEIYSFCERSRHSQNWSNTQLSSEHPSQRGRQLLNSQYHHRPVTRNSNILNAVLCLVKELDYQGLEVAGMAIRCRMDELE